MEHTASKKTDGQVATPHIMGEDSELLAHILRPNVNLALWQRPALLDIARELSHITASSLADIRCSTSPVSFDSDVVELLVRQSLDPSRLANLRSDMTYLANLFFNLSGARNAQFRLVATDRDDCKRFHVDRKHLRMLCTYRGPGTEWLTDAQVDRVAQSRCAPNSAIIRYGSPKKFERFWVGIMKGDPENQGHGLVHRSPPIEALGECRVLFCMDF
ncbi:MAG: DUF1826 domain-containing protein [Pseudomonadota bacterium]